MDKSTEVQVPTEADIAELETAIKQLELAVDEIGGVEAFKQLMATPASEEETNDAKATVAELFDGISMEGYTAANIRSAYLEQKVAMEEANREFNRLIKKNQPPRELGRQLKKQFKAELEPHQQLINKLGGMVAKLEKLEKMYAK